MDPLTDQVNTLLTMLGNDIPNLSAFQLNDMEVEEGERCIAFVKEGLQGRVRKCKNWKEQWEGMLAIRTRLFT